MKKLIPVAAAALALMGAAPWATAATQLGDYFSFSGFGTLGAVRTNTDEGQFGRDSQVGGADKTPSLDVDSNLGVQLTGTATPWLSATVQVLAAKRDKNAIEPDVEWAFVTVKPLDGLTLRGGRMAAPVFAISDSRNVGYANTWVRAPNEVYQLNPFRNFDGADITYRQPLGPVAVSVGGLYGKTKFKVGNNFDATGENLKGLNVVLETDWANFRIGRLTTKIVIPAVGETGDLYTFTGYGVIVDRDNIVAQAEFVKRQSTKLPVSVYAQGWYVLGGYRFGTVLPYAIYSSTKPDPASTFLKIQKTTALGVRWDAFSAADIKFQVERINTDNTPGVSFTTPATRMGSAPITRPVIAATVALDFTF